MQHSALPFLRRFARTLYGTQGIADRVVDEALKSVEADAYEILPRSLLFREFLDVANEPDLGTDALLPATQRHAVRQQRRMHLLLSLEGFSDREAAAALRLPEAKLDVPIETSATCTQLRSFDPVRIVIVEDEPMIAIELGSIMEEMGHEVLGVARTRNAAMALLNNEKPELILCDMKLADGSSGLDATTQFLKSHDAFVIFITAFPEQLLTGKCPEPVFMLSKPFRRRSVVAMVNNVIQFREGATHIAA